MYFQQLKALKGFENISDTDIILFDAILFSIYQKGFHNRFNPRVYRQLNVQLDEQKWLKILDSLSKLNFLDKYFELCSPYSHETIEIYKKINEIPLGSYKYSPEDNADFEVTENDIFITYSFNDVFKPLDFNSLESEKEGGFFSAKKFYNSNQGSVASPGLSLLDSSPANLSFATWMEYDPHGVIDQYVEDNRATLSQMLKDVALADSTTSKGNTLEDLIEKLFSFPYLKFHGKKIKNSTGEIDLAFRVKRTRSTLFESFSDLLIIESKNWKDKAGAPEVRVFSDKMKEVESNVGILFSKQGVTGNESHSRDGKGIIRDKWRTEKLIILVIDFDDLEKIIDHKYSLYKLLEDKYYITKLH